MVNNYMYIKTGNTIDFMSWYAVCRIENITIH